MLESTVPSVNAAKKKKGPQTHGTELVSHTQTVRSSSCKLHAISNQLFAFFLYVHADLINIAN